MISPFLTNDNENFEIRFENADLLTVVDGLNRLTENFTFVSAGNFVSVSDETSAPTVSGYFSGNIYEIVRDVSQVGGFSFDRIDDHFYIGSNPVDLSLFSTSTMIETSLTDSELQKLLATFGQDVNFTLVSSKLLIYGRFYAVKKYREYVEKLNEKRRSYIARLVFVRLDQSSVSRMEAALKASRLDLISSGYNLYDLFEAQLDVKFTKDKSYQFSEQLLYCTDGQKSQLKIGNSFSRENRSVSDYGTSSVTGYQQFEDGVDIELTPSRSINGLVDIKLKFGNSKFSDASTLAKSQIDLTYEKLTLEENRLYFVATLNESNRSGSFQLFGLNGSQDNKALTCWLVISPVESQLDFSFNSEF